jgi:hypothetical protein
MKTSPIPFTQLRRLLRDLNFTEIRKEMWRKGDCPSTENVRSRSTLATFLRAWPVRDTNATSIEIFSCAPAHSGTGPRPGHPPECLLF